MPSTKVVENKGEKAVSSSIYRGQNLVDLVLPPGGEISLVRVTPMMEQQIRDGVLSARLAHSVSNQATRSASIVDYSLSPVSTGEKWIDGKSVFRCVVSGLTSASNQTKVELDFDVDSIISFHARMKTASGAHVGSESDSTVKAYVDAEGNLVVIHDRADLQGQPFHVVMDFTQK